MRTGRRTILVVDDEPQVLKLVEQVLRPRPFDLLVARRPSEALRLCELKTVDVLISDVNMTEMGGVRLAERVQQIHPNARVLLMAQHAPRHVSRGMEFLAKPFYPSELLDRVENMLRT